MDNKEEVISSFGVKSLKIKRKCTSCTPKSSYRGKYPYMTCEICMADYCLFHAANRKLCIKCNTTKKIRTTGCKHNEDEWRNSPLDSSMLQCRICGLKVSYN